jgi:hypothetical protein
MSNDVTRNPRTREDELEKCLVNAIEVFNKNRVPILKKAFEEGGDVAVAKLEREYDSLRDAYFEILQRQLDRNHYRYNELKTAVISETRSLEKAITSLEKIENVTKLFEKVISLVGQAVIILGL